MRIPNSDRAVIESSKLTEYLLNIDHKRGGAKAKLLILPMSCFRLPSSMDRPTVRLMANVG